MATRIRLQRFGRKGYAFYQVVVADSRAPRDGKFIERIGSYNPNTNPATIDLKFDRALYWLQTGAQPTDTARMILSREGVCLKKHLLEGVKKGAFDEASAESRFDEWRQKKDVSLQKVKDTDQEKKRATVKARLDAEKEINKTKAASLVQKRAELSAALEAKAREAAELAAAEVKSLEATESGKAEVEEVEPAVAAVEPVSEPAPEVTAEPAPEATETAEAVTAAE